SAMKSARALGFATSRHLHHVPGHDRSRSQQAVVLDIPHQHALTLDVTFRSPLESAAAIRDHVVACGA
ncbi:hypothetical protein ACCT26_33865, partial [Rhizobium ruizarguesonis]